MQNLSAKTCSVFVCSGVDVTAFKSATLTEIFRGFSQIFQQQIVHEGSFITLQRGGGIKNRLQAGRFGSYSMAAGVLSLMAKRPESEVYLSLTSSTQS